MKKILPYLAGVAAVIIGYYIYTQWFATPTEQPVSNVVKKVLNLIEKSDGWRIHEFEFFPGVIHKSISIYDWNNDVTVRENGKLIVSDITIKTNRWERYLLSEACKKKIQKKLEEMNEPIPEEKKPEKLEKPKPISQKDIQDLKNFTTPKAELDLNKALEESGRLNNEALKLQNDALKSYEKALNELMEQLLKPIREPRPDEI